MTETLQALTDWAYETNAEEFGFYMVVKGSRIVIPLSLTADEPPEPETESTPPPADPRPEWPTDPGE